MKRQGDCDCQAGEGAACGVKTTGGTIAEREGGFY